MKRRNTYDYDKRGSSKYNDDYYDYDDEDYYDEEPESSRRYRDKEGSYNKRNPYDKRDYRDEGRGGGRGDNWRDNKGYYDRNQPDSRMPKPPPQPPYGAMRGNQNDDNTRAENEERVVYLNNLNYDTNEQSLRKAFKEFGHLERVNIGYRRDGKSLGNAQITFKFKRDAQEAVDRMDGVEIDGRPIKIKIFKSWDAYRKEKEA